MNTRILGTAVTAAALVTGSVVGATSAAAQEHFRGTVSFPSAPVVECD